MKLALLEQDENIITETVNYKSWKQNWPGSLLLIMESFSILQAIICLYNKEKNPERIAIYAKELLNGNRKLLLGNIFGDAIAISD